MLIFSCVLVFFYPRPPPSHYFKVLVEIFEVKDTFFIFIRFNWMEMITDIWTFCWLNWTCSKLLITTVWSCKQAFVFSKVRIIAAINNKRWGRVSGLYLSSIWASIISFKYNMFYFFHIEEVIQNDQNIVLLT